jgi:hypothetical protein
MRCYLVSDGTQLGRLNRLVGAANLHPLAQSGGKFIFTNWDSRALAESSNRTENKSALW